ncbi:MAG: ATP-binding protein [Thermodesulfobacteriota bacterium]
MFEYIKKSVHAKILVLIIGIMAVGVTASIFWELRSREQDLLEEKLKASRFMARPVLNAIYEDMLEERADLARRLLKTLSHVQGVEIKIIRSNGVEEAFRDLKTIKEVKKEYGEVKPEWTADHPDVESNLAKGSETEKFKEAYNTFKTDWKKGPTYYTEQRDGRPFFTYLNPIEKKPKCNTCHTGEGARGILMISTPLDDMYLILASNRNQWFVTGLVAVFLGGILISTLVKRSVTGPIRKNVEVIKRIADGKADISERVDVHSEDELGYLSSAFNNMLDSLEKRDEENKRLFKIIEKSKEEWVATFDSIQDLMSLHDRDDRVLKVNRALARKLNMRPEEMIGMSCKELFYGGEASHGKCPHNRTLTTGGVMDVEVDDLAVEGTYKLTTFPILSETGTVGAVVHVARDITLEKLLREQLLHAEKLSSVGKLVAGIAHELNNPLMGIMGFSQILIDTSDDKSVGEIKGKLEKIYHESMRTARIVQNLLTFARAKKTEREYTSINETIEHTFDLREYSLTANNIAVTLDLDKDLPATMVDKYQIQQVFINIINNAEDAMVESSGGGSLTIRTRKKDGKIEMTFIDDGPGIPADIIHKVFDPFFTTKEVGKGTGLGLSITHGIITEHGGTVKMDNNPGGGAVVTVRLPIVKKALWDEVWRAFEDEGAEAAPLGEGEVLIADDEESIRESLAGILTRRGFNVDSVADGALALEALKTKKYTIVITDIKMPGLNGIELYREIEKNYPGLKNRVIMLTGDVFSEEVKEFLSEKKCPFFLKPFETKELLEAVKKVLSA